MKKPVIASRSPSVLELEEGEYWWCSCGLSNEQPFCDGSHDGTDFSPEKIVIEKKKRVALCNCKHSGKQAFCDGAHSSLP